MWVTRVCCALLLATLSAYAFYARTSQNAKMMLTSYDPRVLIQSPTTQWVMRRGLADRAMWGAIASSARKVCAEMVQVDVMMNVQLETGKLLLQRRDQGYYSKLHHPFHDNPCLPAVGNYPLSVMGVLLSPELRHEFTNSDTLGTAMEAIAFDWSRVPGMEDHIKLMVRVATLVRPFILLGGQGTVVNTEFLWQHGRDRLMEFLQAATCADELEELWKRMDEDDEEVDPSGMVLEISGQREMVFGQGSGETLIPIEDAGGVTTGGTSRLSGTRMLLWNLYSRVVPNWKFSIQDRSAGRIFDSTKGYPGEGPTNGDGSISSKGKAPCIPEDHLDTAVTKRVDQSSDQGEEGCFGLESQPEQVVVEAAATEMLRLSGRLPEANVARV